MHHYSECENLRPNGFSKCFHDNQKRIRLPMTQEEFHRLEEDSSNVFDGFVTIDQFHKFKRQFIEWPQRGSS